MTEISQIMADIFSTTEDYDHNISLTVTASKPRNSAGIVHIGRIKYGYPIQKYSQVGFLMNTIRILEDGCTQQYMQVSLTFQSRSPIQNSYEQAYVNTIG